MTALIDVSWLDVAAIILCGAWLGAGVCVSLRVPRLEARLVRYDPLRMFARWTMFAAVPEPDRSQVYAIEYRDPATSEEWRVGSTLSYWSPAGFVLNPRRLVVEALYAHMRQIIAATRVTPRPDAASAAGLCERIIGGHLERMHPRADGGPREIRFVTLPRGLGDSARVLHSFTPPSGRD